MTCKDCKYFKVADNRFGGTCNATAVPAMTAPLFEGYCVDRGRFLSPALQSGFDHNENEMEERRLETRRQEVTHNAI